MGWTVLYIAFGCVALWLLGEVLLQYKARLRWRLLAFCGFLCVVLGVLMSELLVILVGTAAFGAGQLFVTLSFRRGFSTGWALGGRPGSSRRRRAEGAEADDPPPPPVDSEPVLEVSQLEETSTYQPLPLPDDTGQYGVYDREEPPAAAPSGFTTSGYDSPANHDSNGYDALGGYGSYGTSSYDASPYGTSSYDTSPYGSSPYGTPVYGSSDPYGSSDGYDSPAGYGSSDSSGYGTPYGAPDHGSSQGPPVHGTPHPDDSWGAPVHGGTQDQTGYSSPLYSAAPGQPYGDAYGYDEQQYAPYADPYTGGQSAAGYGGYPGANDLYDPLTGNYPAPGGGYPAGTYSAQGEQGGYGAEDRRAEPYDPYAQQTPPGGVWVPQQREADPQRPTQEPGCYGYYDPQRP